MSATKATTYSSHRPVDVCSSLGMLTLTPKLPSTILNEHNKYPLQSSKEIKARSEIHASNLDTKMLPYYGRKDLHLLASNNPDATSGSVNCYSPAKVISVLSLEELSTPEPLELRGIYERKGDGIHDAMLDELRIQGLLGIEGQGGLSAIVNSFGLLRIGFTHQQKHPIVLLICVKQGTFSRSKREQNMELQPEPQSPSALLQKIKHRIAIAFGGRGNKGKEEPNSNIKEKRIFIDICETLQMSDHRSAKDDAQAQNYIYTTTDDRLPPVGASIGITEHYETGSLCCYVKRSGHPEVYALTNCHMVFGARKPSDPYHYLSGDEKLNVQSPSAQDHDSTSRDAKFWIEVAKSDLKSANLALVKAKDVCESSNEQEQSEYDARIEIEEAKVAAAEKNHEDKHAASDRIEGFDCNFGYVLAASGYKKPEN